MLINGIQLIEKGDMVVKAANGSNEFEPESFKYWMDAAKQGGIMIDVGAYTGVYSIAARKAGASVFAFEPNPAVMQRLRENIALNGVDELVFFLSDIACSDKVGKAALRLKPSTPLTSAGELYEGIVDTESKAFVDVQTHVLDKLFVEATMIKAIKIDVEGHETKVIKGADKLIERCRPLIIAEALSEEAFIELKTQLSEMGYNEFIKCDEHNVVCRSV